MKIFLVKYNFSVYKPTWTPRMIRTFGEHNEGFTITGIDQKSAFDAWDKEQRPGDRISPGYLTISEVK